jgi:hypothetical protein
MKNVHRINQHIYITSDEQIKEGDYVIEDIGGTVYGPVDRESIVENPKKIILTTDPSLAPDVQKIDDTFLEWFVKNPSCESVETYSLGVRNQLTGESGHYKYEIIIPQEEPKQRAKNTMALKGALDVKEETLEDTAKKFTENLYYKVGDADEFNGEPLAVYDAFIAGAKWQQERRYSDEEITKIAYDYVLYNDIKRQWVIEGMKLYREQFKKKGGKQ